jgi:hypothetical protein
MTPGLLALSTSIGVRLSQTDDALAADGFGMLVVAVMA